MRDRRLLFLYICGVIVAGLGITAAIMAFQKNQIAIKQWNNVLERQAITVGIDPGEQPYSFYSDKGWDGLDADICREIARRLHLSVQNVPVGYDSLYDSLRLSQVDMVMSAVTEDSSRLADYAYSDSYFDAGLRAVSANTLTVTTIGDMAGMRIVVVLGGDADQSMRYWQRRLANVVIVEAADSSRALSALTSNQAEVFVTDVLQAMRLVTSDARFKAVTLMSQPYVIALRRDNPILLEKLNRVLSEMKADGTLTLITNHWSSR